MWPGPKRTEETGDPSSSSPPADTADTADTTASLQRQPGAEADEEETEPSADKWSRMIAELEESQKYLASHPDPLGRLMKARQEAEEISIATLNAIPPEAVRSFINSISGRLRNKYMIFGPPGSNDEFHTILEGHLEEIHTEEGRAAFKAAAKIMALYVQEAVLKRPIDRRKILEEATKSASSAPDIINFINQLQTQVKHDDENLGETLTAIGGADLNLLDLSSKRDLLARLIAADPGPAKEKEREKIRSAMTELYLHMDLDPAFRDHQQDLCNRLTQKLKDEFGKEMYTWAESDQGHRKRIMQEALEIHRQVLGVHSEPPKIDFFRGSDRKAGENVHQNGDFNFITNTIEINIESRRWNCFEGAISLLVHEATHAYQRWLVSQLAQGTVPAGDPRHLQVTLFALNEVGYLNPLDPEGREDPSADQESPAEKNPLEARFAAYRAQPVERYAFQVDEEVESSFVKQVRCKGESVLKELMERSIENPLDLPLATQKNKLMEALENWERGRVDGHYTYTSEHFMKKLKNAEGRLRGTSSEKSPESQGRPGDQ